MKTGTRVIMVLVFAALVSSSPLSAQTEQEAPNREAQLNRLLDSVWWNNPDKVSGLNLTEAQRAQMDDLLVDHHNSLGAQKSLRRIRAKFNDALVSGSWDQAHKLSVELVEGIEESTQRNYDLKIQVMRIMTGEQREVFSAEYPRLFTRQWLKRKASKKPMTSKERNADSARIEASSHAE